jgi:type IV pilus assembly protein PilA
MKRKSGGFTLIELMIVVTILGILATMAMPSFQDRVVRAQVQEALRLTETLRADIAAFYRQQGDFPRDNTEIAAPPPRKLIGNYVTSVRVESGAIQVQFGNRINAYARGKYLSLRPEIVVGSPASPISWLCGYAEPVPGMIAVGKDRTDLSARFLPPECWTWRGGTG